MTNQGVGGFDLVGRQGDLGQLTAAWPAQYSRQQPPLLPSKFDTFRVPRKAGVIGWRATYEDFRAGGNKQVGTWERAGGRFAQSKGMDTRYIEQMVLAQLTTLQAANTPAVTSPLMMSSVNAFNTQVMAVLGTNGANPSVYKETSGTNPVVVGLNWVPSGQIISLTNILIGGYTQALRLMVGYSANPPSLLSDVASPPTVVGAMNVALAGLWGAIQTPQPNDPILFYTALGIQSMPATAAFNAAPSSILPNVPQGGYALGVLGLAGAQPRAWWVWPKGSAAGLQITLALNNETPSRVMSTDLDGYTPTELRLDIKYTIHAVIFRDGIAASDMERVIWTNGRAKRDTKIFADRPLNSNFVYRVRKLTVNGPELIADVDLTIAAGGAGFTTSWKESYDFDLDTWSPISEQITSTSTGMTTLACGGLEGGPLSQKTGFMHSYDSIAARFNRIWIPPYGTNTFSQRQSPGAPATTGREFAASGSIVGTACWLPAPVSGLPLSITKVTVRGDMNAGGAAGGGPNGEAMTVGVGGIVAPFFPRIDTIPQVWEPEEGAIEPFYQLQPTFTMYRTAANTYLTPQGFPVEIEGIAFVDAIGSPSYQAWNDA